MATPIQPEFWALEKQYMWEELHTLLVDAGAEGVGEDLAGALSPSDGHTIAAKTSGLNAISR